MKIWKLAITLKIADSWIADGFDASERIEEIEQQIQNLLPFAYEHEFSVKAKVVKAPATAVINKLQGY